MTTTKLPRILGLFLLLSSLIPCLPAGRAAQSGDSFALTGARIYPSPSEAAIENGIVLVRDGKIAAVGNSGKIRLPAGVRTIDCSGLTIVAGFWNSHVHFTDVKWK